MKKNTNKRMTKRIANAVVIAAIAIAMASITVYAATYLKGDVDGNGKVNLKDAQMALRGALCIDKLSPDAVMRGDVDGDEKITLKDTQQILRAALCITELGTGETDDSVIATDKPDDGDETEPSTTDKPANTAQPSASDKPDKTEPVQTDKPATTAVPTQTQAPAQTKQPDKPQNPVHTHGWNPVYRTVHHDAVGHNENVVVKDAWDEEKLYTVVVCNQCGAEFSELNYNSFEGAVEAWAVHSADSWDIGGNCDNYRNDVRIINTIHHPAVTEQRYVIDKAAYDEQVIDHYECTCGATK